jgi:hypothetical protein
VFFSVAPRRGHRGGAAALDGFDKTIRIIAFIGYHKVGLKTVNQGFGQGKRI